MRCGLITWQIKRSVPHYRRHSCVPRSRQRSVTTQRAVTHSYNHPHQTPALQKPCLHVAESELIIWLFSLQSRYYFCRRNIVANDVFLRRCQHVAVVSDTTKEYWGYSVAMATSRLLASASFALVMLLISKIRFFSLSLRITLNFPHLLSFQIAV